MGITHFHDRLPNLFIIQHAFDDVLEQERFELAIVEFSLESASTGPEAIASKIPYISMFPAKLCSIHLQCRTIIINHEEELNFQYIQNEHIQGYIVVTKRKKQETNYSKSKQIFHKMRFTNRYPIILGRLISQYYKGKIEGFFSTPEVVKYDLGDKSLECQTAESFVSTFASVIQLRQMEYTLIHYPTIFLFIKCIYVNMFHYVIYHRIVNDVNSRFIVAK